MGKSIFDKYQDLLDMEENDMYRTAFGSSARNRIDDDDVDTLFGSEDLSKLNQGLPDVPDDIKATKGPAQYEEEVHFHRYTTRRRHKYTEQEMEAIRESCKTTIVHDYSENDMFHLTDEERAKNDLLAEMRVKLHGVKSTYSKVDQYISAMRVVIAAIEMIEAKSNFIHTKEEFFEMVSDGRIYISGVPMPRLRKADRFNMDLVIKYISSPDADPSDLVVDKSYDSFYDDFEDDETEEEAAYRLLSEDECKYILEHEDNPEMIKVHDIPRKEIKGYDQKSKWNRRGKKKKLSKKEKYSRDSLHYILNKIQNNPMYNSGNSSSWLVTNSMFEQDKEEKSFWDDLYFDGSWTNKNDLFLYDMAVREKMLDQHPDGERYLTYQDKEIQDFFRTLEDAGLNVVELRRSMNMTDEQLKKKESKKVTKDNRKIESALVQRLEKLNGDPKFKKLVNKAEKAINKQLADY